MGLAPDVSDFFKRVASSASAADVRRICAAWQLAENAHLGQIRQSGEPYITHPLAVAQLLFDLLEPDPDALCAALLHDVIEDSDVALSSIREQFGASVALIVDGVSKIDKVRVSGAANAKEETLRKLVAAGGRDWRVFAVKLCDRLHNMRTLGAVGVEKQRRIAAETLSVFFPLARYVGFARIATEMEALSLRWLHPWRWAVVERWVRYRNAFDSRRLKPFLGALSESVGIRPAATADTPSDEAMIRCYSLLQEDRASRALFAVPCVWCTCSSIDIAYQRVAALHGQFVFVPASFYSDASEGKVSTKVLLGIRGPVAEFSFAFPRIVRGSWVRSIGDAANSDEFAAVAVAYDHPGDFTRVLRELVFEKSISVFSPKGQRLTLPRHASGLDFAFAIHTDLGLRTQQVRVNGILQNPLVELVSGDIVEVIASNEIVAKPGWETALRSPRSRAKLRQWLRESAKADAAILGKRLLIDALGIGASEVAYNQFWGVGASALLGRFGASNERDLWHRIGTGQVSAFAVATSLRGTGAERLIRTTVGHDERSRLTLDGKTDGGVRYCAFCQPIPGDEVKAVASSTGAQIHRSACAHKLDGRASSDFFWPVWATNIVEPLPTTIVIKSKDRRGLLADCARAVTDAGLNVVAVKSKSTRDSIDTIAVLEFTVLVRSRASFERCLLSLRSIPGVYFGARPELL